jgi:ketosteroid isomerase-like protein
MNRRVLLRSLGAFILTPAPANKPFARQSPATAPRKTEEEVRQAEKDRFAAMVKADVGALDKLLAPDLSYTHGDARVLDKAGFIADFKSGAFKYASIELNEMNVRVFGDVAVVTGGAAMHVIQNGADAHIKIRYTDVHVRHNGLWQMVAWEATRMP